MRKMRHVDSEITEGFDKLGEVMHGADGDVLGHGHGLTTTLDQRLLGHQQLLDQLTKQSPKLIEDLIPGVISLTTLHKVLQNLLSERVPIRVSTVEYGT